jgi:hypothetical protein
MIAVADQYYPAGNYQLPLDDMHLASGSTSCKWQKKKVNPF